MPFILFEGIGKNIPFNYILDFAIILEEGKLHYDTFNVPRMQDMD